MQRTCALCALLGALGCGGFKPVGDGGAGDLAAPPGADLAGQATGPGPWGALPSGYCCARDEECRYRQCVDVGGARRCADECSSDGACEGGLPGLRCAAGRCEPAAPGPCVPAETFTLGGKKLGACCVATKDNRAGHECEGGLCVAFGAIANPYICVNVCSKPADCPGNFDCLNTGRGYGICAQLADPYSCTP